MVLTKLEIGSKGIVQGSVPDAQRPTTYDATVGTIIREGVELTKQTYTLPPRGIVWVISAETFELPEDVTGLATLRTTWTHDGVLALNVGVVDPGWNGPLAAALVNFGNESFPIRKGEPFFRILFHGHGVSGAQINRKDIAEYKSMILNKSKKFSSTFLNMDSLVTEVTGRVMKFPFWGMALTVLALLVSVMAITYPIGYSVWTDNKLSSAKVDLLQAQIEKKEAEGAVERRRLNALEAELACLKSKSANPKARLRCQ